MDDAMMVMMMVGVGYDYLFFFFLLGNSYNRFEALWVVDRFYEGILFGTKYAGVTTSGVLYLRRGRVV